MFAKKLILLGVSLCLPLALGAQEIGVVSEISDLEAIKDYYQQDGWVVTFGREMDPAVGASLIGSIKKASDCVDLPGTNLCDQQVQAAMTGYLQTFPSAVFPAEDFATKYGMTEQEIEKMIASALAGDTVTVAEGVTVQIGVAEVPKYRAVEYSVPTVIQKKCGNGFVKWDCPQVIEQQRQDLIPLPSGYSAYLRVLEQTGEMAHDR